MTHTPGPWTLHRTDKEPMYARIEGENWHGLAKVVVRMNGEDFDDARGVANAHLITAAPDLLDTLKLLVRYADEANTAQHAGLKVNAETWSDLYAAVISARAAIDKAEGK